MNRGECDIKKRSEGLWVSSRWSLLRRHRGSYNYVGEKSLGRRGPRLRLWSMELSFFPLMDIGSLPQLGLYIIFIDSMFGVSNEGKSISFSWFVLLEQRLSRLRSG